MAPKHPNLLILVSVLILQVTSFSDVIINEISTKQTERALRWDEKNQPFSGTWPAWWMREYDNSEWRSGRTPIGYDLGNIRTNVKDSLNGISPSLYVIKKFQVGKEDSSSLRPLLLRINYNDGFIAWLNGKEIARANNGIKNSHIYWDQVSYRASSTSTRLTNIRVGTANDLLINGENTIAIQLNNHNPLTSLRLDFAINIDETGTPDKVIVPTGSTVSFLPGLMEPGSGIHEPAIFEKNEIENENSDWIEIYNSGSSSVDLSNWSLSDSENVPD